MGMGRYINIQTGLRTLSYLPNSNQILDITVSCHGN